MRPLISYYGGKQRLVSKLVPLIPKHTVYCEPFAGGAALLFAKPWPKVKDNNLYREVINDTCGDLVNLYRQAQMNPEALAHRINCTAYSEAEHRLSSSILRRETQADALELAWAYYVNLQMGFSHQKLAGWARAKTGMNGAATWHARDIWAPLERLRSVYICNTDALKFIKQWDSPHTFFYCDPPYPGTDQGHYDGYTLEDFNALITALDAADGALMLSCYNTEGAAIPSGWRKITHARLCAISGTLTKGSTRAEVIYTRPARGTLRPEIAKLYATGAYDCFTGDAPAQRTLLAGLKG